MANQVYNVLCFAVGGTVILLLSRKLSRDAIADRLHFWLRRIAGPEAASRPASPEKNDNDEGGGPDYSSIFPPSRRFVLVQIPGAASKLGKPPEQLVATPEKMESVPLTTEVEDANKTMYTPCGFSVEEIKKLGDFPDYAALSGVPLPQPYPEFDIDKAKPRPYRPFRWAYHQTMCKFAIRQHGG